MGATKAGDVVVIVVRGKPRLAWYASPTPNGEQHLVSEKLGAPDGYRVVDDVIALERQPETVD